MTDCLRFILRYVGVLFANYSAFFFLGHSTAATDRPNRNIKGTHRACDVLLFMCFLIVYLFCLHPNELISSSLRQGREHQFADPWILTNAKRGSPRDPGGDPC